ncbi:MAG: gamma carbonic anhydrase family protein [Chloroflexi bacterium]|nr:gamma carbonic anhydrase family protein [Chloroflexota bacterium]
MIVALGSRSPRIAESAFISEYASVIGDVQIGEYSAAFPGAVIRGDLGGIKIGNYVLIEDNAVVHCDSQGLDIGDDVTLGHGAVVDCRKIGSGVLVGMNATVLRHAEIGDSCVVAAGAVVAEGMIIPKDSFVAGVPAEIIGSVNDRQWKWKNWRSELRSWWWETLQKYKRERL